MLREEYEEQFARFERDITKHTLTVLRDDGLYRHLRCSAGSYCYQFDVITWPGYLCYTGDMGCFVFSRLPDMFAFFRGRRQAMVDRSYLAEKCTAADKSDGLREFSERLFESAVRSDFAEFTDEWSDADKAALWDDIRASVLDAGAAGSEAAIEAAMDYTHKGRIVFPDFWEHRLEDYTPRFSWCCYAIPWAIEQYDAVKVPTRETVEPPA